MFFITKKWATTLIGSRPEIGVATLKKSGRLMHFPTSQLCPTLKTHVGNSLLESSHRDFRRLRSKFIGFPDMLDKTQNCIAFPRNVADFPQKREFRDTKRTKM